MNSCYKTNANHLNNMSYKEIDTYMPQNPPDDGFDRWCDLVICNEISDSFFEENDSWLADDEVCNHWLNKLFRKGVDHVYAAKLIERAHKLYIKSK